MSTPSDDSLAADSEVTPDSHDWTQTGSSDIRMLDVARAHYADLLLDAVDDALALFDQDDRLVYCNRAYLQLLASDESALLGCTALELLEAWLHRLSFETPADRERLIRQHAAQSEARVLSFDVGTQDGRHLRVTDRRTTANGRVRTIRDLTAHPRREVGHEPGADDSAGTNTADLGLFSRMSCKLLTTLNAMLGFAQLMQADRREPLPARHRERLERILQNGEHLGRSIDDLVEFARLGASMLSLVCEPVQPVPIVEQVIRALEPAACQAGTSIWLETPATEIPAALVHAKHFFDVLMHLGANAVRHNRPNGAVRFSLTFAAADRLRVSVHDNGNGVAPARQSELSRLFGSTKAVAPSAEITGTGLIIAKRLTELMGGSIGFKSTPGAGSEFWIEVPLDTSTPGSESKTNLAR